VIHFFSNNHPVNLLFFNVFVLNFNQLKYLQYLCFEFYTRPGGEIIFLSALFITMLLTVHLYMTVIVLFCLRITYLLKFVLLLAGWNMLFFLWGVFRGKRVNCIDSSKKLHIPSLNVVPLDKDIPPAVMTLSENLCSPRRIDEELPTCDRACTMVLTSNAPNQMHVTVSGGCDSNKTYLEQTSSGYQEDLEQQDSRLDSKSISKIGTSTAQVSQAMRRGSSSLVMIISSHL
jgi:hypothetical protein